MPKSYLVGAKAEFTNGHRKVMSCDGTEVGVFMTAGHLVAWLNVCPHRGGPVCQGRLYSRVLEPVDGNGHVRALAFDDTVTNLVCSWHGYEFDVATGINQGHAQFKLKRVKLEEKDGNVYVVV